MLCQSLLCSKVTPFYSYGHVLYSFPLWFITGYWESFPVLYSRTLLFAHPLYNSLHLLIPISYSFSLPTLPPWHPQVLFSVCESFSVLWIGSFVSYFRFHKRHDIMWYLSLPFWLTSLSMIISSCIHLAANGMILFFMAEQY